MTKDSINLERLERACSALLSMQRNCWEQGVAAQAFLELGKSNIVIQMATEAVYRQKEDGRLAALYTDPGVTDPASAGEAVLYAYKQTNDSKFQQAAVKMLDYLMNKAPKTKDGILHHITSSPQVWIDAMYMAPPFLAVAGEYKEAIKQISGFRKYLWDPGKKLYSHAWDEAKNTFERKNFWGVGNGWAAAGITRVINVLPDNMKKEREMLIGWVKEGIDGCLECKREDHLFHDVVDNPETFAEVNLAQMLAYSIYRGVRHGWLDPSYKKTADQMREAVYAKVDNYGFIQDVCGAPHFDRPGIAPDGQTVFILMETASTDCM